MFYYSPNKGLIVFILSLFFLLSCKQEKGQILLSNEEKEWVAKNRTLTFSVDDTYPPLNFRNDQGELVGLNIDLIKLIGNKIGIPIILRGTNWDQALKLAMSHEVDGVINATPHEERKDKLVFTSTFMQDPQALVTKKDAPNFDLSNKNVKLRVAAKKNSTQLNHIKNKYPHIEIHEILTLKDGLNLIILNEVDILYDDLAPLYHLISTLNLNFFKIASIDYNNQGGGIGLRNNDPVLTAIVNKAIAGISDAEKNELKEKWINISAKPDYTLFYIVFGFLALVIVLSIIWNSSLKLLVRRKTDELSIELDERKKAENQLIEYKEQLETKVEKRTSDLIEVNNKLVKSNDELTDQKKELYDALSHLKETQNQLIHAEKMASVGILSSGVAHEINNPLNFIKGGINGLSNTLKTYSIDQSQLSPFIDIIEEGVSRATKIVKSLSHFSRSDKEVSDCDIHKIMDNCLIMLRNQLKHRIEITKNYATNSKTIIGNEGKLHQAFLNIVSNAEQSIENQGNISIKTIFEKSRVKVMIKDDGCGIKEENKVKIGNPFFTTKDPNKGTGLGLFITFKIIEDHNGKINYVSNHGIGTEVEISLPYNS